MIGLTWNDRSASHGISDRLRRNAHLWAAKVTACLLYAVFFAVLILISMWFDQLYLAWYYWLLPLSLPVLGSCVYALRKNRGEFVNRL